MQALRRSRAVPRVALLGLVMAVGAASLEAQAADSPIGQIQHHIRSITPFTGPHGSDITVEADGLEPNTNYHIAFGEMQGCGYQVCEPTRTNARGEIMATIQVPDWTHTEHYEVVLIMGEDFVPWAVSDPFHVTDEHGLVQRVGVIGQAWAGCASLETEAGVTYALVGRNARTLLASRGHTMKVEGRIVEGTCTMQYAIEVESLELVDNGG